MQKLLITLILLLPLPPAFAHGDHAVALHTHISTHPFGMSWLSLSLAVIAFCIGVVLSRANRNRNG